MPMVSPTPFPTARPRNAAMPIAHARTTERPEPRLASHLRAVDVFRAVPDDVLARVDGALELIRLTPDEVLVHQGTPADGLYVVVEGQLGAFVTMRDAQRHVGTVGAGEIIGEVQALTGGDRTATIRAATAARVVRVRRAVLQQLVEAAPGLVEAFAALGRRRLRHNQLAALLPALLGPVEAAQLAEIEQQGQWVHVRRGERLLAQGSPSDTIYLVVSGRLQAVVEEAGRERVLGEITRGEPIGEIGIFTGEPRMASIYALRDSELLAFPKPVFDQLVRQYPDVLMAITRMAVQRTRAAVQEGAGTRTTRCITLVPTRSGVPAEALAVRLKHLLGGTTLVLTPERLDHLYGTPGAAQFERHHPDHLRLTAWLDEQETRFDHVLYVAEHSPSPWSRQTIQRADHVLLCAWAHEAPAPGPTRTMLVGARPLYSAQRSLLLLHRNGSRRPTGTAQWLAGLDVHRHHHIRWDRGDDIARLGRFLTGRAVGLTLGGGGARGLAHIGVVQACRELGIPIDFVGGTSMGGCIAALAALEYDYDTMRQLTTDTFITPRPFQKYTLPLFSMLRNGVFDASAARTYGTGDIEDCWLNCFCVASNLSTAETLVLEHGPLAEVVLSSMALPGTVTPRIRHGQLIVDGAVLNNLPVDVMRERAHRIIAVDVGGAKKGPRMEIERFPSPWRAAWQRFSPFHRAPRVPTLMEIMLRSALLASTEREGSVEAQSDVYLRPPVSGFGLLQMDRLEEIVAVGYQYGLEALSAVRDQLT